MTFYTLGLAAFARAPSRASTGAPCQPTHLPFLLPVGVFGPERGATVPSAAQHYFGEAGFLSGSSAPQPDPVGQPSAIFAFGEGAHL